MRDPAFRLAAWLRGQDKARADGKVAEQQTALLDSLLATAGVVAAAALRDRWTTCASPLTSRSDPPEPRLE